MENNNESFIHQPHDKLFKQSLSNPAAARDILSLYLPPEILSLLDLTRLELQPNSFIDAEHRTNAVDLLYKTRFQNEEGYIWILLEHQRKSDYWMPARIFKYIAVIWEHVRRNSKTRNLPFIYPIIIYNGDHPWPHSLNLSDLIQPEAARTMFATLFTKPFHLIDLTSIPDTELKQAARDRIRGTTLLMALKHANDRNFQSYFEQSFIFDIYQLDMAGDSDGVLDIISYLFEVASFGNKKQILLTLNKFRFSKKVEDKMSTMVEYLREEGRLEATLHLAKRLLKEKNFNQPEEIEWLHRVTGVSVEELKILILES